MNAMLLWKTKLKKESLGGQGLRAGPRESGGERERLTVLSSTPYAASLPEIVLPSHHSSGAPPTFSVTRGRQSPVASGSEDVAATFACNHVLLPGISRAILEGDTSVPLPSPRGGSQGALGNVCSYHPAEGATGTECWGDGVVPGDCKVWDTLKYKPSLS